MVDSNRSLFPIGWSASFRRLGAATWTAVKSRKEAEMNIRKALGFESSKADLAQEYSLFEYLHSIFQLSYSLILRSGVIWWGPLLRAKENMGLKP